MLMRTLTAFFVLSLAVVACSADGGDDDGDDGEEQSDVTSEQVSCDPKLKYYPVRAKHNNGYDKTAGDESKWTCDSANSNSDYNKSHLGNDVWADEGAPLIATVDGTFTKIGYTDYSGRKLTIKDKCGWYHYYTHLKGYAKGIDANSNGKTVKAGTIIGYVGKSGTAANGVVHLHYSIYKNNDYNTGIDPHKYLKAVEKNVCSIPGKASVAADNDNDDNEGGEE